MNSQHTPKRATLSAAISAAVFGAFALPAQAQTDAQTMDEELTALEEVVVTATRREATIKDIPYNISAVGGDVIDRGKIMTTGELLRGVAGASVIDYGARNAGAVNAIRIRGLAIDSNINMDVRLSAVPPVSTYINDTPLYANMVLKDLERVEVLRGPQGTLYGSGSLGGTVRYMTRRPVLGEAEGRFEGAVSSTSGSSGYNWDANAILNMPFGDTFALRAVVGRIDYDGVIDLPNVYVLDNDGLPIAPNGVLDPAAEYEYVEDADTIDITYARVSALWEPNDTFNALLTYSFQEDDIGGRMQPTEGVDGWGDPYDRYENGSVQREPSEREVDALALEMNIDFGFATLTSSTSSYDHSGESNSENTGFYAASGWLASFYYNYPRPMASAVRGYGDEAFVQELRLVSNTDGALDWIVGAFYRDQDNSSSQYSYLRGFYRWTAAAWDCCVVDDNDFRYDREENFTDTALFGELTWNISDTFRLTGGFRSFDNEYTNHTFMGVGLYTSFAIDDEVTFEGDDSDTLFKFNASWDVSDDMMLYGTVSEGYRRGGANAVPLSGTFAEDPAWQVYDPDTTTNYEIGLKGGDARSFWNVSLYYVDWMDIQLNTATTNWGFYAAQNGGDAHTQGVEFEYDRVFGGGWHASVGYSFNQGELDETFMSADDAYVAGVKGAELPGLSEHTINVMLENTMTLGNGWDWNNRISGYWQDDMKNHISDTSASFSATLDSFALFDFNSTLAVSENWSFGLFAKNLFNEKGVSGVFTENYMGTDPAQNYYGSGAKSVITRPRTIGVSVVYDF
ncbi:TonB-dependent receptor [Marinihelvus fidelis]|uniref:TonB-dependent receptor n=1 Tax=Marinihelvus fidelis TaxID=2613842 RepID=A0A5N0TFB7_9GAMM|nr:TonB-dependent receptor [Marinihelvus fidelis]KAA9133228.1 TonB-dependent receptor [Marinihelvus fidelis]